MTFWDHVGNILIRLHIYSLTEYDFLHQGTREVNNTVRGQDQFNTGSLNVLF